MASQSRGAPYPLATDPNNTAADLQALSLWVNDRPGVSALTTTERNALTGVALWDGRLVLNTTLDRLQRYDLGLATWVTLADFSEIAALLATSGTPAAPGTASRGVATTAARSDHVHPEATWTAYTPTRTNFAVSSDVARWIANGKMITVSYRGVLSGAVTGDVNVGLPFAAASLTNGSVGTAIGADAGTANHVGAVILATVSAVLIIPAPSSAGIWAAATPFVWTAGDSIQFTFSYERA